ncbi:hypothetical protein V3N99_09055 [Dermatophilaceae bacterium Soc4.6]
MPMSCDRCCSNGGSLGHAGQPPRPTTHDTNGTQILIADKGYYGAAFEADLAAQGVTLLCPARRGEAPRPGERFLKPLRQISESIFDPSSVP